MDRENLLVGAQNRIDCMVKWRTFVVRCGYEAKTQHGRRAVSSFKKCVCWRDIFEAFGSLHIKCASADEAEELAEIFIYYELALDEIFTDRLNL